jgi:hypothetical protein
MSLCERETGGGMRSAYVRLLLFSKVTVKNQYRRNMPPHHFASAPTAWKRLPLGEMEPPPASIARTTLLLHDALMPPG